MQERLRLVNENDSRVTVRAIIFALVSWLPPLILAALQRLAINEDPHRSLLLDFTAYGRFLLAIPLMIVAENVIDDRYVMITSYFYNSGVIPESERPKYLDILTSAQWLVTSVPVEIILLTLAYLLAGLSISYGLIYEGESWRIAGPGELSLAGWWSLFVSLPLFNFLFLRWLWRLIVWCIFLWRLSRLKLELISTHPDFAGGLGILSESLYAFTPIIFALSALLASNWGNRVLYHGANVTEFHRPFLVFLLMILLISTAPLMIFTGQLIQLKLRGLHDYGVLAAIHYYSTINGYSRPKRTLPRFSARLIFHRCAISQPTTKRFRK
jgi:hypothetical protein